MFTDYGDEAIAAFESEARRIYGEAGDKAAGELSRWADGFRAEDERMAAAVAAGALSAATWRAWRRRLLSKGGGFAEAAERAAGAIHAANVEGYRIAELTAGGVREHCADVSARELSERLGEPVAAPPGGGRFEPRLDERRSYAWARRRVRTAVRAGMERGSGIPDIAAAVRRVSGMSRSAAVRAARTAVTSAECSARLDVAKAAGGGVLLEWISARDGRTRLSHREMDGKTARPGERFPNGLRFPGDPQGRPEEVYNCRCTLGYVVGGVGTRDARTASGLRETAYGEWKAGAPPYSAHALDRMAARGVSAEHVADAVSNPIFVSATRYDEKGMPSRKSVGRWATVAFNPKTKVIITVYRTGAKTRRRAERRRDETR